MNQGYQYAMPYQGQTFNPPAPQPGMEPGYQMPTPPMGQGPSNQMMQPGFPPQQPGMNPPFYPSDINPNTNDPFEESYIENILRLNKGKVGTFYLTYSDSLEWRDKIYRGIIQAAGRDHVVISDPRDGKRYILLLLYIDYIEFDEAINYEYPIR